MMTLEEAIRHCKETAERCTDECGAEHRRLAEWLQELQDRRDAEPGRLTDEDLETIRIHLSAFKEQLCNQGRWGEAREYERIIFRLKAFAGAQKLGKWERKWSRPNVYADLDWHCSACSGRVEMQWAHIYYKYCPYCGVRMASPLGEYEEGSNG